MIASSSDDTTRVYEFLADYISAKGFSPSLPEIAKAGPGQPIVVSCK